MHKAFQHLGCTNQAAQANVDQQGINSLEELCFLLDEDVETLYRNVKHPGGQTLAGGANLGQLISQCTEKNIKLVAYWLHYSEKVSRPRQIADITVANVQSIHLLMETEGNYEEAAAPTIDDNNWPKTADALNEYCWNTYGLTKIPLLYIVNGTETLVLGPEDNWDDHLNKMIDWAPH